MSAPALLIVLNNTVGQLAWGVVYSVILGPSFVSEHHQLGWLPPLVVNCFTLGWTGHRVIRLRAGGMLPAMAAAVAIAELGIVTSASAPNVGVQTWHGVGVVIATWSLLVPLYAALGAVGAHLGRRNGELP
jgi:hypothetical protein